MQPRVEESFSFVMLGAEHDVEAAFTLFSSLSSVARHVPRNLDSICPTCFFLLRLITQYIELALSFYDESVRLCPAPWLPPQEHIFSLDVDSSIIAGLPFPINCSRGSTCEHILIALV